MMLDQFRYQTGAEVRFADLDVLGHLNHAKYLTYMEQARILYVQEVCEWFGNWETFGVILAKAVVEYKLPIHFNDQVRVYVRCSRLGGKSFDLEYVVTRQGKDQTTSEIAATALTVLVAYDYRQNQTIAIPTPWRERILAFEPIAPSS